MKTYFFFSLIFLFSLSLNAQDYSIAAAGKTIKFNEIGKVTIVGTNDSKLTFSREEGITEEVNKLANGLRKISASGHKDNTGFGVSVTTEGDVIMIDEVGSNNQRIIANIPNSATVVFESSSHQGGKLEVSDFSGELDVSIYYHKAYLKDVTGPVAINAVYNGITATFSKAPTEPIQLHSAYSNVDLTLPESSKVDVALSTSYGSMYTDFDMVVKANGDVKESDGLNAKINGGGPLISLTATYRDIYLRKQ